jgi:hypothetical protein
LVRHAIYDIELGFKSMPSEQLYSRISGHKRPPPTPLFFQEMLRPLYMDKYGFYREILGKKMLNLKVGDSYDVGGELRV